MRTDVKKFSDKVKKVRVGFSHEDSAIATVTAQVSQPGSEPTYVLNFDDGRRMLVGVVREGEMDEAFLAELGLLGNAAMVNPCGADIIEDLGLDPEGFDTTHEGGLFPVEPVVEGQRIRSKKELQ